MSAMFLMPVVCLLGALGRRIAGGVLNQWFTPNGGRVMGDTPARLIFAALVAAAAFLGGAPWALALVLIPANWVGTVTGNFNSLSMASAKDYLGMSAHAALSLAIPALAVVLWGWHFGTPPLMHSTWLLMIMLAAPLYRLGWAIAWGLGTQNPPGGAAKRSLLPGLNGGTEWGEALWGAAYALGTFLTFAA